jgi:hypothetical protein
MHRQVTSDRQRDVAVTGVDMPVATRSPRRRETAYGAMPPAPEPHRTHLYRTVAQPKECDSPRRSIGARLLNALRDRGARLIPAEWRALRWREATGETLVASYGTVEIRRTPGGCVARTCVKGDLAQARETALRRILKYMNGENRSAIALAGNRPVMQQQLEPRRWLISVRLTEIQTVGAAPTPLGPKVKVVELEPEMLAVVRVAGRPGRGSVSSGDAIILAAIANTKWVATGPATIRSRRPGSICWLTGGFEVAVPVVSRW